MKTLRPDGRVVSLPLQDIPAAAGVLAQAMADNPLHQRLFTADSARLKPLLYAGFTRVLEQQLKSGRVLAVFRSGKPVAVTGMFSPGHCLPNLRDKLTLLPPLWRAGMLHRLPKINTWLRHWSRHDPDYAHWHLGPAGVERSRQARGYGTLLLEEICHHLDEQRIPGYLETDRQRNVRLYERFGFKVIATEQVLGVPQWFMLR